MVDLGEADCRGEWWTLARQIVEAMQSDDAMQIAEARQFDEAMQIDETMKIVGG